METLTAFLWRYIIGPVVADAQGVSEATWQGVTAVTGYNLVNTSVWALLAALVGYGIYILFERQDIRFDRSTVVYSLPFVVLGGVLRFVEDAGAGSLGMRLLLITPVIYFLIAGIYLLSIVLGEKFAEDRDLFLLVSGSLLTLPVFAYSLIFVKEFSLLLQPFILASGLTLAAYLLLQDSYFDAPIYLAAVFSQFFGGAASMVSLSQGYSQKQLLAQQATSIFGEPGILVVKAGVLFLAFKVLKDIEEEDVESLLLMALMIVGLATGLRVALRVSAGI